MSNCRSRQSVLSGHYPRSFTVKTCGCHTCLWLSRCFELPLWCTNAAALSLGSVLRTEATRLPTVLALLSSDAMLEAKGKSHNSTLFITIFGCRQIPWNTMLQYNDVLVYFKNCQSTKIMQTKIKRGFCYQTGSMDCRTQSPFDLIGSARWRLVSSHADEAFTLTQGYKNTRIFIRQWHKNVHWNLSWWRSNHYKQTNKNRTVLNSYN